MTFYQFAVFQQQKSHSQMMMEKKYTKLAIIDVFYNKEEWSFPSETLYLFHPLNVRWSNV